MNSKSFLTATALSVIAAVAVAQGRSELAVAASATGSAVGACQVTGDGARSVALKCTGSPDYDRQVQEAIATLPLPVAVTLQEEVASAGYAGATLTDSSLRTSFVFLAAGTGAADSIATKAELTSAIESKQALEQRLTSDVSQLRRSLQQANAQAASAIRSASEARAAMSALLVLRAQSDQLVDRLNRSVQEPAASGLAEARLAGITRDVKLLATVYEAGKFPSSSGRLEASSRAISPVAAMPPMQPGHAALAEVPSPMRHSPRSVGSTQGLASTEPRPVEQSEFYAVFDETAKVGLQQVGISAHAGLLTGQRVVLAGPFANAPAAFRTLATKGVYPLKVVTSSDVALN